MRKGYISFISTDSFLEQMEFINIYCYKGRIRRSYDTSLGDRILKNYSRKELKDLKSKCQYFKFHKNNEIQQINHCVTDPKGI